MYIPLSLSIYIYIYIYIHIIVLAPPRGDLGAEAGSAALSSSLSLSPLCLLPLLL